MGTRPRQCGPKVPGRFAFSGARNPRICSNFRDSGKVFPAIFPEFSSRTPAQTPETATAFSSFFQRVSVGGGGVQTSFLLVEREGLWLQRFHLGRSLRLTNLLLWGSHGVPFESKLLPAVLFLLRIYFRSHPGKPNQRKASSWTFPGGIPDKSSMWIVLVFPRKTPEFTKMGEIHEVFVLALSLVWFAGATPDYFPKITVTVTVLKLRWIHLITITVTVLASTVTPLFPLIQPIAILKIIWIHFPEITVTVAVLKCSWIRKVIISNMTVQMSVVDVILLVLLGEPLYCERFQKIPFWRRKGGFGECALFPVLCSLRAQRLKKKSISIEIINPAWKFQSRLKISIPTFRIPHKK